MFTPALFFLIRQLNAGGGNWSGQLGDGTNTDSNVPVSVSGITNATAVSGGGGHTCALLSDSTVECWGRNGEGELGNGTNTDSNVPVSVSGINNATAVSAGDFHTCALLSGSVIKAWGFGYWGQIDAGIMSYCNTPVSVVGFGPSGPSEAIPEFTAITAIIAACAGFGIFFVIRQRKRKTLV